MMNGEMKALLLTEYMHLELTDVAVPVIGPHDVLIRVRSCGICGSDVHGIDGSTGRRIPPLVMGHEAAGLIAEVGAAVSDWKPGDRVTFDSTISCGECAFCRSGDINFATTGKFWESRAAITVDTAHLPNTFRFRPASSIASRTHFPSTMRR